MPETKDDFKTQQEVLEHLLSGGLVRSASGEIIGMHEGYQAYFRPDGVFEKRGPAYALIHVAEWSKFMVVKPKQKTKLVEIFIKHPDLELYPTHLVKEDQIKPHHIRTGREIEIEVEVEDE